MKNWIKSHANRVKRGLSRMFSCFVRDCGVVYAICTGALSFVSLDDFGLSFAMKIVVLLFPALISVLLAVAEVFLRGKRLVWACGDGLLEVRYGDMFKSAKDSRAMRVIPVNTTFDTIVDEAGSVEKPLVSPSTLHGRWIKAAIRSGLTTDEIDRRIAASLSSIRPQRMISERAKPRGKRDEYPTGTIAAVSLGDTTYLLISLSTFDDDNVARSDRDRLIRCIVRILEYHNRNGQESDLFIPLMGTGRSRVGLDHSESLAVTLSCCRAHADLIHGRVSVMVYDGDSDKVSIWD